MSRRILFAGRHEGLNVDNDFKIRQYMADFKKGRKSQSQKRSSASRARRKSQKIAKKRNMLTHSTAFAFIGSSFGPPKTYQIGHFRLQPVNPILANLGGSSDAFTQIEDYGKYAPFRLQITAELTTCEEDWGQVTIDGERFIDLDSEDRASLIQKFSSDIILLLRLKGLTNFTTPISITGSTFRELREKSRTVELRVWSNQSMIDFMPSPNPTPRLLDENDIRWIEEHLSTVNQLNREGRMNFIYDIYDSLNYPNVSIQLMSIWSGIESIVHSESSETGKSIRYRCAMILEDEKEGRMSKSKRIGELYRFRCKVIHGDAEDFNLLSHFEDFDLSSGVPEIKGENSRRLYESYKVFTELLLKVLEKGRFWSPEELRELQNDFPV